MERFFYWNWIKKTVSPKNPWKIFKVVFLVKKNVLSALVYLLLSLNNSSMCDNGYAHKTILIKRNNLAINGEIKYRIKQYQEVDQYINLHTFSHHMGSWMQSTKLSRQRKINVRKNQFFVLCFSMVWLSLNRVAENSETTRRKINTFAFYIHIGTLSGFTIQSTHLICIKYVKTK